MYLLTKSETLNPNVAVTFTAGTHTGNIIDSDRDTYSETLDVDPNLTIDLVTPKAIDAIFLRGENLHEYDLKGSLNNISYTDLYTDEPVTDGKYSFVTFANTTAYRFWRLSFSQRATSDPAYRVSEIFLCRLLLDLNSDEKRPFRYQPSVPEVGTVAYELYNGQAIQYKSESDAKTTLTLEWENLADDLADELESLWKGPPHAPTLTIYGRPLTDPDGISTMKWDPVMGFSWSGAVRALGKRGRAVFREV